MEPLSGSGVKIFAIKVVNLTDYIAPGKAMFDGSASISYFALQVEIGTYKIRLNKLALIYNFTLKLLLNLGSI